MLQTATNLSLKITTKTGNKSSLSIANASVSQKIKPIGRKTVVGRANVVDGFITKSNNSVVNSTVANSGTNSEVTTLTVSAIIPYNERVKVATLTFVGDTGYSIDNLKTFLSFNKVISGLSVELVFNHSNTKLLDLFVQSSKEVSALDNAILSLNYSLNRSLSAVTPSISNVIMNTITGVDRAEKDIKIIGTPNTPFTLCVLDENNNSIITSPTSTSTLPVGVKPCLSSVIGKNGKYIYKQSFPAAKSVLVTKVNGSMAVSGASTVIFDSLSGVQVDDHVLLQNAIGQKIYSDKAVLVKILNPTGGNANECVLSQSIVAADNARVKFARPVSYKINVDTTATKKDRVPATFPTITLNQIHHPTITVTASHSNGTVRINGATAGADDIKYYSKPRLSSGDIYLTYVLTGKTFTQVASKVDLYSCGLSAGDASFTKSASQSGTGTSTFTVVLIISVDSFGTKDSSININLEKIAT